jgi:DOPA 4,5-dioxygenase
MSDALPPPVPASEIASYHAHVYFDPASRDRAAALRERIAERFPVQLGRWHDGPVGPHPQAMYQVAFDTAVFPELIPWLMLNRLGLTVFTHPNTDNPHDDHLVHAVWMGEMLPLHADMLPHSMRAAGQVHSPVVPNTHPSIARV